MTDISTLPFSASQNAATSVLRRDEASGTAAEQADQALADEFDEFMLLLTTQLQNQDPTEPLDTNEFTQQLVQFTGVEQSVATNKNLETLIALNSNQQIDSAVGYIDKYVKTTGNSGFLSEGQGSFSYDLPAGSTSATITILDQAGRPVHTDTVDATPGNYVFNWDGTNSFDGTDMPDGIYEFGLSVRDATGELVDAETFTAGFVTSVGLEGDQPVLTIGDVIEVNADKVLSVSTGS